MSFCPPPLPEDRRQAAAGRADDRPGPIWVSSL